MLVSRLHQGQVRTRECNIQLNLSKRPPLGVILNVRRCLTWDNRNIICKEAQNVQIYAYFDKTGSRCIQCAPSHHNQISRKIWLDRASVEPWTPHTMAHTRLVHRGPTILPNAPKSEWHTRKPGMETIWAHDLREGRGVCLLRWLTPKI